jgi:hypothetical protein
LAAPWVLVDERTVNGEQVPCSEQPPADPRSETTTDCETGLVTTTSYETPYVLVDFEWVPGEEVVTGTSSAEATDEECVPPTTTPVVEPPFECDGTGDGINEHNYNDPTDGVCAAEVPPPAPPAEVEPVVLDASPVAYETLPNTGVNQRVIDALIVLLGLGFALLCLSRFKRPEVDA